MTTAESAATRIKHRPRWLVSMVLFAILITLIIFFAGPIQSHYELNQGRQALTKGNYYEAIRRFQSARKMNPHNAEIHFWLARASRKIGDLDGVRNNLEEAERLGFSDKKRLSREWWIVLAESGRMSEAEPHLTEMLLNAGDDGGEICDAFTKGYCMCLRFAEAKKLLEAWQTDFPDDFRPYVRRGQIYADQEKWGLAADEFNKAVQRAPDEPLANRELARMLIRTERSQDAEPILQRLIERDPTDAASLMILAQMMQDRKETLRSLGYLNRVLDQQPQDFSAGLMLSKLQLAAGNPEQAVKNAERLVQQWPEDLNAIFTLAQALRATGRLEDATVYFTRHSELQNKTIYIEELIKQAKTRPSDPEVRYELGLLLLKHVSRSEGVAWLLSVFQFDPAHRGAHQALAEYYRTVGNSDLAKNHDRLAERAGMKSTRLTTSSSTTGDRPE